MNAEQTVTAAKARSDFRPAFNKVNMRCISSLRRKRRSDYARKRQDNCNATDWEEDCGLWIADFIESKNSAFIAPPIAQDSSLASNPQSAIRNPQSTIRNLRFGGCI